MFGLLKIVGKALGGDIIGNVFGSINDHFKAKRELKAARQYTELQIELVRAKSIAKEENADIDINKIRVQQQESSWKDEFWTIIFGAMFVSAFFAPERLAAGLKVLGAMDEGMQYLMAVVITTAFGVGIYNKVRK
tara:strand:+ start:1022 stop:1426 length:405 start_codon:yes stop_codon:yes gene_type:complete